MKQRFNNFMAVFTGVMELVEVPLLAILLATTNMVQGRYGLAGVGGALAIFRFTIKLVDHHRTTTPARVRK